MIRLFSTMLVLLALTASAVSFVTPNVLLAPPGITLIGKGVVDGSAQDKSGLTGNICQAGVPANCVSKAIFGGFGSDITYTGHDNVFIAAPDRGPFDGLTDIPYLYRLHFLHITTDVGAPFPNIRTVLLDTRFLKNEVGQTFVGAAGSFAGNDFDTLRLDPEGIRVSPTGTFYISDEYGPYVFEFDRQGHLLRRFSIPSKFAIANPSSDPNAELLGNSAGRQGNRGMEGLAITPDGRFLIGIMQNALLQDHGLTPGTTDRLGLNNRVLKIDVATGETKEYVYVVDAINRGQGVCEILAINDHEFLVLERDNRSNLQTPPQAPTRKKIYKIDLNGATDVSAVASLPAGALPPGIVPVTKSTGEEGLYASLDKDNPPDAILLDLLLPGMSGVEICRRLRNDVGMKHTPILIVSAKCAEADMVASFAVGADGYITKPFSIREVVERVNFLLQKTDKNISSA